MEGSFKKERLTVSIVLSFRFVKETNLVKVVHADPYNTLLLFPYSLTWNLQTNVHSEAGNLWLCHHICCSTEPTLKD